MGEKLGFAGLLLFAGFGWFAKSVALLGMGLMVWAFFMDWPKARAAMRNDPLFLVVGLFLVYLLLAAAWGSYQFPEMNDWRAIGESLSLLLFVFVAWWLRGDPNRLALALGLAFAGFVFSVLGDWDRSVAENVLAGSRDGFGRAIPITALYSATAILGLVVLAARFWGPRERRWMFIGRVAGWSALLVLMVQILITTQSRTTWLAVLFVFPAILLARFRSWRRGSVLTLRLVLPLSLLALGLIVLVVYRNIDTLSARASYENQIWASVARLDLDEVPIDTAIGARAHLWYYGVSKWMERPVFGWGPATQVTQITDLPVKRYSHLHSTYLEALVRFGLVGSLFIVALLFLIIRSAWRAWRRSALPYDYFLFISGSFAILAIWSAANFRMPVDWRFFWCLLAGMAYSFELLTTRDFPHQGEISRSAMAARER